MFIGKFAATFQINPRTVRYYEKLGLLPTPARSRGGYRLYSPSHYDHLRFILRAKSLGFSLWEIKEILGYVSQGTSPCQCTRTLLDRKIAVLDRELKSLRQARQQLLGIRRQAEKIDHVSTTSQICPIIEHQTKSQSNDLPPRLINPI